MAALATRHETELDPSTLKPSIEPLTSIARRNRLPVGSTNYIAYVYNMYIEVHEQEVDIKIDCT